jgi:hypothetical protein
MTDEQLIAQIRGMTDLAKAEALLQEWRDTRDKWVQDVRADERINVGLMNLTSLGFPDTFKEEFNERASEEQEINRIDRFIAALTGTCKC